MRPLTKVQGITYVPYPQGNVADADLPVVEETRRTRGKVAFPVDEIVDERTSDKGIIQYQCTWKCRPSNSLVRYPPEWINAGDILDEDLITVWEAVKAARQRSLRLSKRRRAVIESDSAEDDALPTKKAHTDAPASPRNASQSTSTTQSTSSQVVDQASTPPVKQTIFIKIPATKPSPKSEKSRTSITERQHSPAATQSTKSQIFDFNVIPDSQSLRQAESSAGSAASAVATSAKQRRSSTTNSTTAKGKNSPKNALRQGTTSSYNTTRNEQGRYVHPLLDANLIYTPRDQVASSNDSRGPPHSQTSIATSTSFSNNSTSTRDSTAHPTTQVYRTPHHVSHAPQQRESLNTTKLSAKEVTSIQASAPAPTPTPTPAPSTKATSIPYISQSDVSQSTQSEHRPKSTFVASSLGTSSIQAPPTQSPPIPSSLPLPPRPQTPSDTFNSLLASSRVATPASTGLSVPKMSFRDRRDRSWTRIVGQPPAGTQSPHPTPTPASTTPAIAVNRSTPNEDSATASRPVIESSPLKTTNGATESNESASRRRSLSPAVRGQRSRAGTPLPEYPPLRDQNVQTLIPMPMFEVSHKHYLNSFKYRGDFIEDFVKTDANTLTTEKVHEASRLCTLLCDFSIHQDLISEEPFTQLSQGGYTQKQLAQWSVSVSSKFRFLSTLFKAVTELKTPRSFIVVVKPGLPLKYVKDFLEGSMVSYTCSALGKDVKHDSLVTVHLMGTHQIGSSADVPSADAIIGLDETFHPAAAAVQGLRTNAQKGSTLKPPVIGLVVPQSMEHAVRCTPGNDNDPGRLQSILGKATQLREKAGRGVRDTSHPEVVARNLVNAINDPELPFHLVDLPSIPLPATDSLLGQSQLLTQASSPANSHKRAADDSPMDMPHHGKRARTTPPTNGDSLTQSIINEDGLRVAEPDSKPSTHAHSSSSDSELRIRVGDLEEQLHALRAEKTSLNRVLNVYVPQHTDLYKANATLKALPQQLAKLRSDLDAALQARNSAIDNAKADRAKLQETERIMLGSAEPAQAELAQLRETARRVKDLESRIDSQRKEGEYLRETYQEMSSGAAKLGIENQDLTAKLKALEPQLEAAKHAEKAKMKEHNNEDFARKMESEVQRLKGLVAMRDLENDTLVKSNEALTKENEGLKEELAERKGMAGNLRRGTSQQPGSRAGSLQPTGNNGRAGSQRPSHDLLRGALEHQADKMGSGSRAGSRQSSPGPSKAKRSKLGQ